MTMFDKYKNRTCMLVNSLVCSLKIDTEREKKKLNVAARHEAQISTLSLCDEETDYLRQPASSWIKSDATSDNNFPT